MAYTQSDWQFLSRRYNSSFDIFYNVCYNIYVQNGGEPDKYKMNAMDNKIFNEKLSDNISWLDDSLHNAVSRWKYDEKADFMYRRLADCPGADISRENSQKIGFDYGQFVFQTRGSERMEIDNIYPNVLVPMDVMSGRLQDMKQTAIAKNETRSFSTSSMRETEINHDIADITLMLAHNTDLIKQGMQHKSDCEAVTKFAGKFADTVISFAADKTIETNPELAALMDRVMSNYGLCEKGCRKNAFSQAVEKQKAALLISKSRRLPENGEELVDAYENQNGRDFEPDGYEG